MSLVDPHDGVPPPPLRSVAHTVRTLSVCGLIGLTAFAFLLAAWGTLHGWAAIESPLLWVALAAFWGSAYCLVYAREILGVERALAASGCLEATGVRVYWLRAPRTGTLGASIEIRASSSDPRFPLELALFLTVDLLWSIHVMGVRSTWSCKENGVLLLAPKTSRFLGGATRESLALPSQEEAALRGLLRRPGDDGAFPDWGQPAGEHALAALTETSAEAWLFGPEQPFVALEAHEGGIEKFWDPVASRMVDLDIQAALDLLRVVRAFDRDTIASRVGRPTSSPSRPSSPSSPHL